MATNPTLLTMPIAENGQKNTIPATQAEAGNGLLSQSTGFPPETALPLGAGGVAPSREDFNGAFNLLGGISYYAQKGWFFLFDNTQSYFKGCVVRDATDDKLYECLNDVAAGGPAPSSDSTNWRVFSTGGVPLGSILPYSANAQTPPYGFLFCEGQAISRTMYPDLFDLIGTTYGSGDGSTTFNLPNMLDKYPQGSSTAGTAKAAGLPNITGTATAAIAQAGLGWIGSGAFSAGTAKGILPTSSTSQTEYVRSISFNAANSNAIYGNSNTVTPPTLTVRWIIKAYDAPTPSSAQIDLSQYASDLAKRLTREMTPAFNKTTKITTSGTYTAPVSGWYRIVAKGGGGGGQGALYSSQMGRGGGGGGEGGIAIGYKKLTAGTTATVIIGAGGSGGAAPSAINTVGSSGGNGGNSSVTIGGSTYTGGGGNGGSTYTGGAGGTGTIIGAPGCGTSGSYAATGPGGSGGGNGGSHGNHANTTPTAATNGGGGAGGCGKYEPSSSSPGFATAGGAGGAGYVEFSYFDPTLN